MHFLACCTRVKIPKEESQILGIENLYVPAIEVKFLLLSRVKQFFKIADQSFDRACSGEKADITIRAD